MHRKKSSIGLCPWFVLDQWRRLMSVGGLVPPILCHPLPFPPPAVESESSLNHSTTVGNCLAFVPRFGMVACKELELEGVGVNFA
ncbi:hypothetical protein Tco_1211043 [Tanacetum coccineum]